MSDRTAKLLRWMENPRVFDKEISELGRGEVERLAGRVRDLEAEKAALTEALERDGLAMVQAVLDGSFAKPKLAALARLALARDRMRAALAASGAVSAEHGQAQT